MTAVTRLVTRSILAVALLLIGATPSPHRNATDMNAAGEQATTRSEVRLRKLHLVRPDLIPYPIAYEVCC